MPSLGVTAGSSYGDPFSLNTLAWFTRLSPVVALHAELGDKSAGTEVTDPNTSGKKIHSGWSKALDESVEESLPENHEPAGCAPYG